MHGHSPSPTTHNRPCRGEGRKGAHQFHVNAPILALHVEVIEDVWRCGEDEQGRIFSYVGGGAAEEPGHHFSSPTHPKNNFIHHHQTQQIASLQSIKSNTGMQSRLLQHQQPTRACNPPCGRLQRSFRGQTINMHRSGTRPGGDKRFLPSDPELEGEIVADRGVVSADAEIGFLRCSKGGSSGRIGARRLAGCRV